MTSATSGRCSFTSSSVSSGSVSADPPSQGRTAELPPQYEGKPPWCSGSRVPEGSESSSDPFPLPVGLWQNCGAWYAWSLVCPSAPPEKLVDKLAAPQLSGSGTFPSGSGIAIRPSDGGPCSTRATSPTGGRQRHVTVLAPFPLAHSNHHPLAVDITGFQLQRFRQPQSSRVHGLENRPVHQRGHIRKQLRYLSNTQYFGKPFLLLRERDLLHYPFPLQRLPVEEFQRAHRLIEERPRCLLLIHQVPLILPNLTLCH